MSGKPFSPRNLAPIFACVLLALGAHIGSVPAWVLITGVMAGAIRLLLARRRRGAPGLLVRVAIATLGVGLLFVQFRTFNGLTAGTALLALMAGLKLLETDSQRDVYVIALLVYFLELSSLLMSDSFWLLAYAITVCWLTSATLLRLATAPPAPAWRSSVLYSGRILLQAVPLALAFWLLFPRFAGPLWHLPNDSQSAQSGLSDTMSPGDISELALSDDIAFRVRFKGTAPPPSELYWRGPVLHDFDGHTWTHGRPVATRAPHLLAQGPAYTYTLTLEPNQHNWLFALDWPSNWELSGGMLDADYTLIGSEPVARTLDVTATSHTQVSQPDALPAYARRRDSKPPPHNPRTAQLAQTMRGEHPDDMDFVRAVLALFSQQAFYYTLSPPKLAGDSVDAFLFDTKRGFCGHYASAFAALMRAAGIPARVVTGYQGGDFNHFADYWIVRQSHAHAWNEVWIEGRGWLRVDPTAAVSPQRVDPGIAEAATADASLHNRWRWQAPFADLRMRLDALQLLWRERILLFDQGSQQALLEALHIPEPDGEKLVIVLAAALALAFGWLTWSVRRELRVERRDPLLRAYSRLCGKLARVGLARLAYEGAEDYAARVTRQRPDLGPVVDALCAQYSSLRYGAHTPAATSLAPGAAAAPTLGAFTSGVRAFRPKAL